MSLYRREEERKPPTRWFGHVRCRPTDASVWRVERINLEQVKRAQGRPKKTWMEVIRQDMRLKVLVKAYCSIGFIGMSGKS